MGKISFEQIGFGKKGRGKKKDYIHLTFYPEKLKQMVNHDVEKGIYLFEDGEAYSICAPVGGVK